VFGKVIAGLAAASYMTKLPVWRAVVSVSTSRFQDVPASHLDLFSRKTVNILVLSWEADVSVSAIYVSCPRPIFGKIVQATLIKRVNFGRHGNASHSQSHQLVRSAFIHIESVSQVLIGIYYLCFCQVERER